MIKIRGKMRKVELLSTRDCEAGYGPRRACRSVFIFFFGGGVIFWLVSANMLMRTEVVSEEPPQAQKLEKIIILKH